MKASISLSKWKTEFSWACALLALVLLSVWFKGGIINGVADFRVFSPQNLTYAIDQNVNTSISQAQNELEFIPVKDSSTVRLGILREDVWLKVSFSDEMPDSGLWFFVLESTSPRDVIAFLETEKGIEKKYDFSFSKPVFEREIPAPGIFFPINLDEHKVHNVFFRIKGAGGNVSVRPELYSPKTFLIYKAISFVLVGLFFGIIIAMIFYNLFLYLSVREITFLYYFIFSINVLILVLGITGYGSYFVWPNYPALIDKINGATTLIACIFGLLFTGQYLSVHQHIPKAVKYIKIFVWLGAALLAFHLLARQHYLSIITVYILLLAMFLLFIGVLSWVRGVRAAGFYLASCLVLLLVVIIYGLSLLGILPLNLVLRHMLLIGVSIETMILSLGLVDIVNIERKEKYALLEREQQALKKLEQAEKDMLYQAFHSNFGVPNKAMMRKVFNNNLIKTQDYTVLIIVTVFEFRQIQKTVGARTGNLILLELVTKLSQLVLTKSVIKVGEHDSESIVDVGNGGLALFFQGENKEAVEQEIIDLLKSMPHVLSVKDLAINIDLRVGAAQFPIDSRNFEELFDFAQIALEYAEKSWKRLEFYRSEINVYNPQGLALLGDLRKAINNNELMLYAQPKVDLRCRKVTGCELLLRWNHKKYGFIPPIEFVTAAEKTGLIFSLTYWVINESLSFLSMLEDLGFNINAAINISARCIVDERFQKRSAQAVERGELPLEKLVLEITETAFMENSTKVAKVMNELGVKGAVYSLDDFGTGYSSLAYLQQFPVSEIKIDQSFIRNLSEVNHDYELVKVMIEMAHSLGLNVVAEGVETLDALNILKQLGCDSVQGYYIARPMPLDEFFKWLEVFDPDKLDI